MEVEGFEVRGGLDGNVLNVLNVVVIVENGESKIGDFINIDMENLIEIKQDVFMVEDQLIEDGIIVSKEDYIVEVFVMVEQFLFLFIEIL